MRRFLAVCLLPFTLSGCALLVLGAAGETGVSVVEDRSLGAKVDDHVIYAAVNDQFVQSGHDGLVISATVNVRNARVMLTGHVDSQAIVDKAVAAAWKAKGVKEVYNELIVNPDAGYGQAASDILVKRNLVARFLITKDLWNINYSSEVVDGTAYIIGTVKSRAELDKVIEVARTTKGVKKVVSHLQILGTQDAPSSAPASSASPAVTAPVASAPPTDGTIATEPVESSDLNAPASAPASSPAAPAKTTPTWR